MKQDKKKYIYIYYILYLHNSHTVGKLNPLAVIAFRLSSAGSDDKTY